MQSRTLLRETDDIGWNTTSAGGHVQISVVSDLPSGWDQNMATFRLWLQQVTINPSGVLASLRTIKFTAGNIGYSNHMAAVVPEGQQLLCWLARNGKAEEVMEIVQSMETTWAVWKIIPLCEALIENGQAEGIWWIVWGMDFEKEKRWFFWDRYKKLLSLIKEKYNTPEISTALAQLN